MKKITLLVASIFLVGSVANASEIINFSDERRLPVDFRDADPIVFTERGIEFFVFPDGQFDFNTRPSTGDIYYKPTRRGAVNATHGAPAQVQNGNYGVRVEHDNFGRVRRVGNVFINYDGNDRIKRIGSEDQPTSTSPTSRSSRVENGYAMHSIVFGKRSPSSPPASAPPPDQSRIVCNS